MKPVHSISTPRTAVRRSALVAAVCLLLGPLAFAQDDLFLEGLDDFAAEEEQEQPDAANEGGGDADAFEMPEPDDAPDAPDADQVPEDDGAVPDMAAEAPRAPGDDGAIPPTAQELRIDEEVRRKEWELRAENFMIEAQKAWRDGEFLEAINLFNKADERLKAISLTQPRILANRERIKEAIAQVNADWARSLAREAVEEADAEKFDTASSKAEKAAEKDPTLRKEMEALQRQFSEMKREAEYEVAVQPGALIPDLVEKEFEINVLLEQGKVYFRKGRYADARDKFDQVLVRDPYEVRAMRYINAIHERLITLSEERRQSTVRERIAEVRWKWNEPVTPLVREGEGRGGTRIVKPEESTLMRKLEEFVIPTIDFEDATIQTVVEFLKKKSVELDPEGEGVNIILYEEPSAQGGGQQPGAQPADGAADDFGPFGGGGGGGGFGEEEFGGFGEPAEPAQAQPAAAGGGGEQMGKRITLTLDRIPLGEAIRYITLAANLKFRVDTNAVLIASKDMVWDEMETRFYSVEAGVLDLGAGGGGGGGGGGAEGGFGDFGGGFDEGGGAAPAAGASGEALKSFFSELGVDFPAGSRIAYNERAGKLVVTNTPRNLRALEKALKEINQTPPQVTIEAKFVEVSQDDLQELGFNWLLEEGSGDYDSGIVYGSGNDNWALSVLKQTGSTGKTSPKLSNALRFGHNILEGVEEGSDQILSINSILGGVSFNTIIHALDQRTNSDILSSPKVTTISGTTAVLKMVETRHIAVDWSQPEAEGGSDDDAASFTGSIATTEPQEFGVILDVTPRVAPDGYSIELEMFPRVQDFIGYDDRFNYTMVVNGEEVEAKQLTPITAERSVQTKVIVWDGETVVLGGMMGERVNYWDDKVPLLGDVPVVGRLFRSKGELSEKTNLLIFVTARLVNPAGMPMRTSEIRGLPDFRR